MKYLWALTLLFSTFVVAQRQPGDDVHIQSLTEKIAQAAPSQKLRLLDSLSRYVMRYGRVENDSLFRETVSLALALDSVNVATWHTANVIYIQNNIIGNPKEAKRVYHSFLPTAKRATDASALAKFYIEAGDSYYFLDDYKHSLAIYDSAFAWASRAKDDRLRGLAKLYKGGSLSFMGSFSEASQILQEASKLFTEAADTSNIISARNSLSILYSQNAFYEEAKRERNEAIILAKKFDSQEHLLTFYYNAATDSRKQGNYPEAIAYLKQSLKACRKIGTSNLYEPTILSNLVIVHSEMGNLEAANGYLQQLMQFEVHPEGRDYEAFMDAQKYMALANGNYPEALRYGLDHLEIKKRGSHFEEIQMGEQFLSKVYEALGNKEAAYNHYKRYSTLKDSLTNIQRIKALSYYQTLYETEKRDAQIEIQRSDIALLNAENKLKTQWMVFGGLGLMVLFGGAILIRSRVATRREHKLQQRFLQDLIRAQEDERIRVARELHDSVGQKLMLLAKKTKTAGDDAMESLAGNTLDELRTISRGLHPATLEKLGFTAAITALINEVDANTNIFFTNDIENIDAVLSKENALHLYRMVQEVLSNMVKHSEAKAATITIQKKEKEVVATITDNGKGFYISEDDRGGSLGMNTLRERAKIINSSLSIKSEPNKGTQIQLKIPA
jgi:signal transduction histidine kinase